MKKKRLFLSVDEVSTIYEQIFNQMKIQNENTYSTNGTRRHLGRCMIS